MTRKTVTQSLLNLVNNLNGKKYPDIGYTYYAGGIGLTGKPALWTIVNDMGGVTYSELNRSTPHEMRNALRGKIIALHNATTIKKES